MKINLEVLRYHVSKHIIKMVIKITWHYFMNKQSNKQIIKPLERTMYINKQCK